MRYNVSQSVATGGRHGCYHRHYGSRPRGRERQGAGRGNAGLDADKELPFALKAPNATSRVAIGEANEIIKSRRARFATADALLNDLEEASRK